MPFPLDDFQVRALDALDAGRSVLVAAPTGAGKTLVASYAVETALGTGTKAFYTTPLKALSNQKYAELVATHGETMVGLLTGDTAKRPDAPVVVMTTEVLRNMLLAGSDLLRGLSTVILDEVHYLQDPTGEACGRRYSCSRHPSSPLCACRRRSTTPPSSGTGCARCAGPPTW